MTNKECPECGMWHKSYVTHNCDPSLGTNITFDGRGRELLEAIIAAERQLELKGITFDTVSGFGMIRGWQFEWHPPQKRKVIIEAARRIQEQRKDVVVTGV